VTFQVVVELPVSDPRFDDRIGEFLIHFEDVVHALEDHDDRALLQGERRPVTPVAPFARRQDRDMMTRGDSHDGSHFGAGTGKHHRAAAAIPGNRAARIAVEVGGTGADMLRAEHGTQFV